MNGEHMAFARWCCFTWPVTGSILHECSLAHRHWLFHRAWDQWRRMRRKP